MRRREAGGERGVTGLVTVDLLARLDARVAALETALAELAAQRQQRFPAARDAAVVLALASVVGDHAFQVRDVLRHADDGDPSLRDTLTAARLGTPRTLARWLRDVQHRPIAGLCVERITRDKCGTFWYLAVLQET